MTENPEESLEREEGPTPRWETTQLGLIGPIGFTCSSLRSFILIFVIYLAKVPARSTSTALCNWVPGGEAVVLIGHTWLFHRWVIYLRFGEPGDKEEVKQRGLQDKARREGARGKEAVAWRRFTLATRAGLRGEQNIQDHREKAGYGRNFTTAATAHRGLI